MGYQWDDDKAKSNLRKHGIDFADAVSALSDPKAITVPDEDSVENRYAILGTNALGQLLVVIFMWRGEDIRVISARKATRPERVEYEG